MIFGNCKSYPAYYTQYWVISLYIFSTWQKYLTKNTYKDIKCLEWIASYIYGSCLIILSDISIATRKAVCISILMNCSIRPIHTCSTPGSTARRIDCGATIVTLTFVCKWKYTLNTLSILNPIATWWWGEMGCRCWFWSLKWYHYYCKGNCSKIHFHCESCGILKKKASV